MARFKVGDRVKYNGKLYNGKLATVIAPHISPYTHDKCWVLLFDRAGDFRLAHDGDMGPEYSGRCWYVRDDSSNVEPLTAAPAVPERLKVGQRVRVKEGVHPARSYKSGEIGVVMEDDNSSLPYRVEFSDDFWWCSADDLEPLDAEPEPEPDARVRYAVTREGKPDGYDFDKENCYRTYDDAVTSAKKNFYDGDKQHVEVWKLVAIVNPPAEPEVVKLEETMEWVVIVESTNDIIDRFSTYEEAFAVACDFTKRYEQAVIRMEE